MTRLSMPLAGVGDPTDAELVERVIEGGTHHFETLVLRYQRTLFRHAVAIVLDREAAADMVQDAFIRAYIKLADCRDRSRFRPWLFQTLRRRCFDYLKDARRRNVPLEDAGPLFDGDEDPGARAERIQLGARINRALAELPPDQREAFIMHYVDGESYETMAELLDASVSALKMRASRARAALAAALREPDVTRPAGASS